MASGEVIQGIPRLQMARWRLEADIICLKHHGSKRITDSTLSAVARTEERWAFEPLENLDLVGSTVQDPDWYVLCSVEDKTRILTTETKSPFVMCRRCETVFSREHCVRRHRNVDRCRACGEAEEVDRLNMNRQMVMGKPCASCTLPLGVSPPPKHYLRNTRTRRRIDTRRCGRCLLGRPPAWSEALAATCRHFMTWKSPTNLENLSYEAKILDMTVRVLGCSSIYKVPWRNGLPRLALFLGTKYVRPVTWHVGAVKAEPIGASPEFLRANARERQLCLWRMVGWEMSCHKCCDISWIGWFCYRCNRQL